VEDNEKANSFHMSCHVTWSTKFGQKIVLESSAHHSLDLRIQPVLGKPVQLNKKQTYAYSLSINVWSISISSFSPEKGRCRSSYKVFPDLLRKQYAKQENNGP